MRQVPTELMLIILNGFQRCVLSISKTGNTSWIEVPGIPFGFAMHHHLRQHLSIAASFANTNSRTLAPRATDVSEIGLWEKFKLTFLALIPPVFLIFTVLGSILLALATPTEAAACGALGTVVLTAINGKLSLAVLSESVMRTLLVTAMILTILLAGNMFAGVFIASGGISATNDLLSSANLSPWTTLLFILFLAFLAGFALDLVSVILVFIPIALPLIKPLGFDPVWFCILFLVVIQTSYLTPPMAPSIFYLRAISPPEITLPHMYRGVIPFIFLQLATLILVIIFPALALWLPSRLVGF